MIIDEHIKVLESYFKGRKGFTGQPIDFQGSINFAIETMRKYQKIQEIIDGYDAAWELHHMKSTIDKIREVIKNENDK